MNAMRPIAPSRRAAPRTRLLAGALVLATTAPVAAGPVTDWSAFLSTVVGAFGAPPQQAYLSAIMHLAIHDALNAIQPRYETYGVAATASAGASPAAATAAAARDVLHAKLGCPAIGTTREAACTNLAAQYAAALAAIPDNSAKAAGISAGQAAAATLLAMRVGDGSATPHLPYTLAPGPGVYQPTAPNFPTPQFAGWALVTPFVTNDAAQFHADPGELFDLTSATYATNYNLVKSIGSLQARVSQPNSEETDIARFWAGGGAAWGTNVRAIIAGRDLDEWQLARLFALVHAAEADAAIHVFETKYTYNFWRPVTAIRWADDGNPATESDPGWFPFFSFSGPWSTPPYPDYTCGLPTLAGATTEVMRRYFGTDAVPLTRTVTLAPLTIAGQSTPTLPARTVTRSYARLSDASDEAARSRVYAGIHFYEGCVQGVRHGEKVGRFVIQHALRPLRKD